MILLDYAPFRERIRARRELLGLSVEEAARRADVTPDRWQWIEEVFREVSPYTLQRMGRALSIEGFGWIYGGEGYLKLPTPMQQYVCGNINEEEFKELAWYSDSESAGLTEKEYDLYTYDEAVLPYLRDARRRGDGVLEIPIDKVNRISFEP